MAAEPEETREKTITVSGITDLTLVVGVEKSVEMSVVKSEGNDIEYKYAWLKSETVIEDGETYGGATTSILTFKSPKAEDEDQYTFIAYTGDDPKNNQAATSALSVEVVPAFEYDGEITVKDGQWRIEKGHPIELTLETETPIYYRLKNIQWQKDGQPITGHEEKTLRIEASSGNDAGIYSAILTFANKEETVTETAENAIVVFEPDPEMNVTFLLEPKVDRYVGKNVEFKATEVVYQPADKASLVELRWYKGDEPIATGTTYTKNGLTVADSGTYQLRAYQGDRLIVAKDVVLTVTESPTFAYGDDVSVTLANNQFVFEYPVTTAHMDHASLELSATYTDSQRKVHQIQPTYQNEKIVINHTETMPEGIGELAFVAKYKGFNWGKTINVIIPREKFLTISPATPGTIDNYLGYPVTLDINAETSEDESGITYAWSKRNNAEDRWDSFEGTADQLEVTPESAGIHTYKVIVKVGDLEKQHSFQVNTVKPIIKISPSVELTTSAITKYVGDSVTLSFTVDLDPNLISQYNPVIEFMNGTEEGPVKVPDSKMSAGGNIVSLNLENLTPEDKGNYFLKVSYMKQEATSEVYNLTVKETVEPVISITHLGQSPYVTNLLSPISIRTDVNHEPSSYPLTFKWVKVRDNVDIDIEDNVNFSGVTTRALTITPTEADFGDYKLIVTSEVEGKVFKKESELFTVSKVPEVLDEITITQQPISVYVDKGGLATLTVVANSSFHGVLSYRWERQEDMQVSWKNVEEGEKYHNVLTNSLEIHNVEELDLGKYRVIISNENKEVVSDIASVNLNPVEVTPEFNVKIDEIASPHYIGSTVVLHSTIEFTSSESIGYVWYKDGEVIDEQIESNLIIDNGAVEHNGIYTVEVTIDSVKKSSNEIKVNFIEKPIEEVEISVNVGQTNYRVIQGGSFIMKGVSFSPEDATLQWYKKINGKFTAIEGQTSLEYPFNNPNATAAGEFTLEVSYKGKAVRSDSVFLVVDVPTQEVIPEIEIVDNGDDVIEEGEFDFSDLPKEIRGPLEKIRNYCIQMSPERVRTQEEIIDYQIELYNTLIEVITQPNSRFFNVMMSHIPQLMGRCRYTTFSLSLRGRGLTNISDIIMDDQQQYALINLIDLFLQLSDITTARELYNRGMENAVFGIVEEQYYLRLYEYINRKAMAAINTSDVVKTAEVLGPIVTESEPNAVEADKESPVTDPEDGTAQPDMGTIDDYLPPDEDPSISTIVIEP